MGYSLTQEKIEPWYIGVKSPRKPGRNPPARSSPLLISTHPYANFPLLS